VRKPRGGLPDDEQTQDQPGGREPAPDGTPAGRSASGTVGRARTTGDSHQCALPACVPGSGQAFDTVTVITAGPAAAASA